MLLQLQIIPTSLYLFEVFDKMKNTVKGRNRLELMEKCDLKMIFVVISAVYNSIAIVLKFSI